jgi:hypothetical protein
MGKRRIITIGNKEGENNKSDQQLSGGATMSKNPRNPKKRVL